MKNKPATYCVFMALLVLIALPLKGWAQQCFNDAQSAYAYLEAQTAINNQRFKNSNHLPVNINTASEAELTTLKGIGSKKAYDIILYRTAFGPFDNVDDLSKVKGIGIKTVDKNRSRLITK